ncbi:MAG: HAMP domain-containing histidine kinase, partial [Deltaproteobacteria bacterium]|nr:HAMP domain-containing histidine kinase [Deltaproteobacteria bacterium]
MVLSIITISFEEDIANVDITIWLVLNQITFLGANLILFFIVFEEDIKRLTEANRKLSNQIEKSMVFVNLGEHIAGLIHNLNSDLGILSMSIGMVEKEVDSPAVKYIRIGKERLESKIRNIMTLAKYSQTDEDIEFSINALINSLLEIFAINRAFKRVKLITDFNTDLFFFGNTSEISQVFENIIKNTYEALIEHWHKAKTEGITTYLPYIELDINRNAEYGIISIVDNGPG